VVTLRFELSGGDLEVKGLQFRVVTSHPSYPNANCFSLLFNVSTFHTFHRFTASHCFSTCTLLHIGWVDGVCGRGNEMG
jgi:hypothetical protein